MPRKKCYGSEAEKQRAYRLRKAGLGSVERKAVVDDKSSETRLAFCPKCMVERTDYQGEPDKYLPECPNCGSDLSPQVNLPVPVLAESSSDDPSSGGGVTDGEARESTTEHVVPGDYRGGQNLSSTDQKFEEDRPGWYIFGKVEKEKNCWKCGKKYSTRLEMGRFCSPTCKTEYLDSASHLRQIQ